MMMPNITVYFAEYGKERREPPGTHSVTRRKGRKLEFLYCFCQSSYFAYRSLDLGHCSYLASSQAITMRVSKVAVVVAVNTAACASAATTTTTWAYLPSTLPFPRVSRNKPFFSKNFYATHIWPNKKEKKSVLSFLRLAPEPSPTTDGDDDNISESTSSLAPSSPSSSSKEFVNDGPLAWMVTFLDLFGIREGKSVYFGPFPVDVDPSTGSDPEEVQQRRKRAADDLINISDMERERRDAAGTYMGIASVAYIVWATLVVGDEGFAGHVYVYD